uniref:Uncharacterized protein n=1 Tax=Leersia perrieri TaxID=77586 RepID=A0A0D9XGT6_9ORYZ
MSWHRSSDFSSSPTIPCRHPKTPIITSEPRKPNIAVFAFIVLAGRRKTRLSPATRRPNQRPDSCTDGRDQLRSLPPPFVAAVNRFPPLRVIAGGMLGGRSEDRLI